jgi:membrane-associated PAP2 superfamily phosphatase
MLFEGTEIDHAITRPFFDDALRSFPLTDSWWLKKALHDYARTASALCAAVLAIITLAAWALPPEQLGLRRLRHELAFVTIASLGGALIVGVLKHFSAHACPWALLEYGGTNTYAHLFGSAHVAPRMEGCLPAAHPLAGYAWLCVALVFYPNRGAKVAWRWWCAAFAIGTLFGAVQIMRGAHFLSHVLWTAWIVWAADIALLALYCRAVHGADSSVAAPVRSGTKDPRGRAVPL